MQKWQKCASDEELWVWILGHPIAGAGGGGVPAPPGPTPAETALTTAQTAAVTAQTDIAKQQLVLSKQAYDAQQAFGDFLLSQSGYQRDAKTGAITQITGSAAAEIQNLTQQRYLQALKGELPVDPALERNIAESEQQLRSQLEKNLGPGYETSTPGITAISDFNKRAEELRYGVRTGELTTAAALSQSQFGQLSGSAQQATVTPQQLNIADLSTASGSFGNAARTAEMPLTTLANQRMLDYQYQLENAASKQQGLENLVYSVAQGGAAAYGAYHFCWIAAELYGLGTPKFYAARKWIMNDWKGPVADIIRFLYGRYGERFSKVVRKHKIIRMIVKPMFDIAVKKGAIHGKLSRGQISSRSS